MTAGTATSPAKTTATTALVAESCVRP
jgi:hypothetical protein